MSMFLAKKPANWTNVRFVQKSWRTLGGIVPERLLILDAVWKKEIGRLDGHCEMVGVNKGYIVVKTDSSVAYNELLLSSRQIMRSLNKYFSTPWLKGIRPAV